MGNFLQMVDTQSVLFLYMAVGFLCQRLGILDGHTQEKLTGLVIKFMMPCMVFESFHMELGLEALRDGGVILLIATVMAAISLLLGKVLYLPFPPEDRSVLQYGTLVTNSGFAGLPLVSSAYGSEGLFLGSLFVIPTRILMWSAGISLFTRASGREAVKKVLLNPSILAVELGLARMLLQIPLPHFLDTAVSSLGGCTSPLAMALVGALLADVPPRSVFTPAAVYLSAVRQILLPLLCLVLLRLLHVDGLMTSVSVVLTGMPIGSTTAILAQRYGANAYFASKCVFVSTLSSLVTIPILTILL